MIDTKRAIELIGANIQIYSHFASYTIPDENQKAITKEDTMTKETFLKLVYEYYYTDRINDSYGTDIKEQEQNKRFLIKRINASSYDVGNNWLEERKFQ